MTVTVGIALTCFALSLDTGANNTDVCVPCEAGSYTGEAGVWLLLAPVAGAEWPIVVSEAESIVNDIIRQFWIRLDSL